MEFKKHIVISDEAYKCYPGPILLLAGPGTGKTYQLAKRIQYLTSQYGASAEEITVITFTKEAARSMSEKIEGKNNPEYVEPEKRPKIISTMHSLGHSIIAENIGLVGLSPDFTVVESEYLKSIIFMDAAFCLGFSEKEAKEALANRATAYTKLSPQSSKIINRYEEILRACNAIDYDDQILLACKILKDNETIRNAWSLKTKHLLVDEYQDINPAQFEFISLLSRNNRDGLFVVGDDDQSIYKFRGGSPEFIRKYDKHFDIQSKIIQMKTSRRCKKNILDCANHLIAIHDKERVPKVNPEYLLTETGEVLIHDCPSDDREAEIIACIVRGDMELHGSEKRTAFILVQNKYYAQKIEKAFNNFNIKYDTRKEESKAISKFFLIQEWVSNPSSNLLTRECVQMIIDGGTTLIPSMRTRTKTNIETRTKELTKLAGYWQIVSDKKLDLWAILNEKAAIDTTVKDIVEKLSSIQKAYNSGLGDFLKYMVTYVKPWATKDVFYDELSHIVKDNKVQAHHLNYQVRILTMQSAKGLEAELVFVVGLEEGHMPKGTDQQEIAEDARLIFVAMTRAKDQLHLFHSRKREGYITFKGLSHSLVQSSFISCLPSNQVSKQYHPAKNKKTNRK